MTAITQMAEMAAAESARASVAWEVGGSDRYAPVMPSRPRPKRTPIREEPVEKPVALMPAFDEALEHVMWCRSRGMTPQSVIDSVGDREIASTWSMAVAVVEQEIMKMRAST